MKLKELNFPTDDLKIALLFNYKIIFRHLNLKIEWPIFNILSVENYNSI